MKAVFVETENVKRFLAGVAEVNQRGAPEASFMLAQGEAGYGKSQTGFWWANRNAAIHLRMQPAMSPHWFLHDLVRELGEAPARSSQALFDQAYAALARRQPAVVVDEVEHALHDLRVIETLRGLSDLAFVPVVLVGREFVGARLRREKQIWSRISAVVNFGPLTLADVELLCARLTDVAVAKPVAQAILDQTAGRIREALNAIAKVERIGRRTGGTVDAAAIEGVALTQEHHRTRTAATAPAGATRSPALKVV